MAGVFQKAVAVDVPVTIHPIEGAFDVAPNRTNEFKITGTLVVSGGEHHKQRGGIDAAVVAAKRDLFQGGHLAFSQLVKNLSGLGVLLRYDAIRLGAGQKLQDAPGQSGLGPQHLQSGDEAVAAKYGVKPGYPSVWVGTFGIAQGHHLEIGCRAAQPFAEAGIGAGDAAETRIDSFVKIFGLAERLPIAARREAIAPGFAAHIKIDKSFGARLNVHLEKRAL